MKKISLWATMLALLVCGLCATSCSKDDNEKDGGGGNGGKKETTYNFDDYINAYYVRCERVGANLVVELVFKNITDHDINDAKLLLTNGTIVDDLGNPYYVNNREVVLASATNINSTSNYSTTWQTLNIPANGYAIYYIKIYDFDSTNSAKKLSFDLSFTSSSLPVENFDITAHDFDIEDHRVKEHGIMTNDTALVYTVTNCERVGSVLQIDFTVTNNSNIDLGNLTFVSNGEASDDLGNHYYSQYSQIAFGAGTYKNTYTQQLEPGKTINGRLRITDFDATNKAKFVSVPITCSSSTYTFTDNVVRFLTIPIKDNRPLAAGIQTPDLKLDIDLKSATVDENGYLVVNYTITNNTGENLTNVGINDMSYLLDDLSNSYSGTYMKYSINGGEYHTAWWGGTVTNIAVDASISVGLRLETPFDTHATKVSFSHAISCDNYEFADSRVRFLTIPIQK